MALEPIDLLVDVSKVLYNERIIEQRKQIEELKKQIEDNRIVKYMIYMNDYDRIIAPASLSIEDILQKWCGNKINPHLIHYAICDIPNPDEHNYPINFLHGCFKSIYYFYIHWGNSDNKEYGYIMEVNELYDIDHYTNDKK